MNPQFSIPIFLALVAFFVADENNGLALNIYRRALTLGDSKSIEDRLLQLGKGERSDFENFRIAQLVYSAMGIFVCSAAFLLRLISWPTYLLLIILLPVGVVLITERRLTSRCERRVKEIESEFPAIVEMLTLAIGAGESPAAALKRIAARASGHIAEEFNRVVIEVESGTSFTYALDHMGKRLDLDTLRRFVDSIIISISRGTSLVETLTHGANESRNQERVRLLTAAGKSEISMMIPVVFLILPISILFALYPSLANLNLFNN